jgi:hypothetical protein
LPDFVGKSEARVNLHLNLLDLFFIFVMLSNILLVAELFVVVEPCGVGYSAISSSVICTVSSSGAMR